MMFRPGHAGVLALAVALTAAACWTQPMAQFRVDARHQGVVEAELDFPVSLYWKYTAEQEEQKQQKEPEKAFSTPVVSDDHVVFALGGSVYCLDRQTGDALWEFKRNT